MIPSIPPTLANIESIGFVTVVAALPVALNGCIEANMPNTRCNSGCRRRSLGCHAGCHLGAWNGTTEVEAVCVEDERGSVVEDDGQHDA